MYNAAYIDLGYNTGAHDEEALATQLTYASPYHTIVITYPSMLTMHDFLCSRRI